MALLPKYFIFGGIKKRMPEKPGIRYGGRPQINIDLWPAQ